MKGRPFFEYSPALKLIKVKNSIMFVILGIGTIIYNLGVSYYCFIMLNL